MIIFYQIPNDETAVRLRKIIEEDKIEHMYVNKEVAGQTIGALFAGCLLYTSPSPRDGLLSRMPSSA